jgi:hypothetical protein
VTLLATQVTEALSARLRGCVAGAGYRSNVGATVRTGRLSAHTTEAPCIYLLPTRGADTRAYGEAAVVYTRQYEIRAFADLNAHPEIVREVDPDAADADLIDQIIWDVRRCLETGQPLPGVDYLHYLSDTPGYREDGGSTVGAVLLYEVRFAVSLLDPSTPI